ncbi:hypothetical protein Rhein_0629 [Rheinheimera sp. A13L]|nr:hypothetical protein Rhein_0629 [Rheinheimera sp. A13L]
MIYSVGLSSKTGSFDLNCSKGLSIALAVLVEVLLFSFWLFRTACVNQPQKLKGASGAF